MVAARKPTLAVWKSASCDGCQLSLLNCEDELLEVAGAIDIASFPEASREVIDGPYDLSLVEGSISTPQDAERIHLVRAASRFLVTTWECMNCRQVIAVCRWGAGGIRSVLRTRRIVGALTRRPSFSNSPWIR